MSNNLINKIIIISFMLILVINNLAQKKKFETLQKSLDNKIKIMDKLIKSSENKALILNKQLEAFIYYLYNFKNDSSKRRRRIYSFR